MSIAADRAYTALLHRITRGELEAGEFLVETDLARDIGVSRTPVREAIKRLAAEGLVQTEGRRRAVVRAFEEDSVSEIFELRARLEGYAAARAARRIDAEGIERLEALAIRMEACAREGTPEAAARFADLNDAFHQQILEAAASPHLETALRPILQIQLVLLARYRARLRERLERSCHHHREIIRALALHDPELAERQMEVHMLAARSP